MKLRYLTLLTSAMVLASTADAAEVYNKDGNKLDVFGKINGVHQLSHDQDKSGDCSSISYGFSGETKINDQISGFGLWEYEVALNCTESSGAKNNHSRLGHVGLKFGELGNIHYGRSSGVLYNVGAYTDVMPRFGGDTSIVDNFLSSRASNVASYQNSNLFGLVDGFDLMIQYQGKNENKDDPNRSLRYANGNGYGISINYALDNGISAAAAYANGKRTVNQKELNNHGINHAESYSLGLKYDANNLYVAALYNENHSMTPFGSFEGDQDENNEYGFANRVKNIELVAQYQFDFGLQSSIGYLQSEICKTNENDNQNNYLKKYVELGTSYNFNKNMLTFIDYRVNLLKKNDFTNKAHVSTDNILALGMTYTF